MLLACRFLLLFVVKDFIEWLIHRLLHWSPWLWEFHKVHHSVKQMGFVAHFRYHWMENIVYKSLEYVPLAMIGFSLADFFLVHTVAIVIGHWNHANFNIDIRPLKYILNNPFMHIWHHAKELPEDKKYVVSRWVFGTTFSKLVISLKMVGILNWDLLMMKIFQRILLNKTLMGRV